ncbi:MAG: hypothetical protein CVT94_00080 [Bacteroidetes bacterium HGW-Bacteroidetes-11]|jgi:hypothetical protein|nr:MAG: hypothetical protein CVT94_00080 [Bacteroidetes bacterium HGW-Bacteroidetes-11]
MRKFTLALTLAAFALSMLSLQAIGQQSIYGENSHTVQSSSARNGEVIYDQLFPLGWNYMVSQQFTDPVSVNNTSYAADDFTVPAGATWDIRYIDVAGQYFEWTGTPATAFNIYFYADNNGVPGTAIHTFENFTNYNEILLDEVYHSYKYEFTLPAVIPFTSGVYWVSVQAVADYSVSNQWGWYSHQGTTIGNEFHWKNPGNGFGTGNIDWTAASMIVWSDFNLAFSLYGDGLDNDLSLTGIVQPNTSATLTASEQVVVSLKNEGNAVETGFNVSYSINGGTPVVENVGAFSLAPNQIANYTFTATANLSTAGSYLISATVTHAGDPVSGNNTASKTVYNLGTIYTMPSTGTQTITSCGATFTDAGGLDGDIGMNDDAVTTIYPANAGDRVRLTFLEFNASWGGFTIYDGTSTSAPLIGTWMGTNSPGVLTALNADGALTIHFMGPGWETTSGWVAYISCITPVANDFALLDLKSSLSTIFQNSTTILSSKVQNYGSMAQEKTVTFKANGVVLGTQLTGMLNPADTVRVSLPWTPDVVGEYTIEASIPEDDGAEPDNSLSMDTYVYAFDAFFEDFETGNFPPENWINGVYWGAGYYGFSGNSSAMSMVPAGFSDTLISTRLNIAEDASFSFYAVSSMWWPGNLNILWKEEGTSEWIYVQNPALNIMQFTRYEVDMSAFAGQMGRIGFRVNVSDPYAFSGQVTLDYILGQNVSVHFDEFDLKAKEFSGNNLYSLGEASDFTLTIRNNGLETVPADDYRVKLLRGTENPEEVFSVSGLEIASGQELTYDLSYTFTDIGEYKIYAEIEFLQDQYLENNTSAILMLSGIPAESEVITVGETFGYTTYSGPVDMAYNHSLYETLYLNDEIGKEGVIFGIAYDYSFMYPETEVPVRVWVGTTEMEELPEWIPAGELELAFDGNLNFIVGEQTIYIPFQTPFNYNDNTKNLVVMVEKIDNHTNVNQGFSTYSGMVSSTKYTAGYTNPPNPYSPPGAGSSNANPVIRFVFNDNLGSATGIVSNSEGMPIEGASVKVNPLNITTYTDASGAYELPFVPAGTYPATADKFAYSAVTESLGVTFGNTTTLDFIMSELALVSISGQVTGIDNPGVGIENATISLTGYAPFSTTSDANGNFTIEGVYSLNTYQIHVAADGFATYSAPVAVAESDIDLGEIVLSEAMLIPYVVLAAPTEETMNITWHQPAASAHHVMIFEDGVHEQGWAGEIGEEVWLGNHIPFDEPATVTGFDVYWAKYNVFSTAQPMRLDIFDEDYNLVVSSDEFSSGMDEWLHISIPNITLEGDHYAMIYWYGTPEQSTFLAWDSTNIVTEYACYKYAGGDIALLSGIVGTAGNFLIRPHVMTETVSHSSGRALTGYDIRFGELTDISNAENWPVLNTTVLNETEYNDSNWPPAANNKYVYAVQAYYTTGESELSFSNVIDFLGVNNSYSPIPEIRIYPNPASEYVTIIGCNDAKVLLFGMDGKLRLQTEARSEEFRLNLNGLAKGAYLIVVQTKEGIKQQKLLIE